MAPTDLEAATSRVEGNQMEAIAAPGPRLKPFDLVRVGEIPYHNWADAEFENLREYAGSLGLVTYHQNQLQFLDDQSRSGWIDQSGTHVNVMCVRAGIEAVNSYSFWLPIVSLTKLRFNPLVLSVFANVPLYFEEPGGVIDNFGLGSEFYELVKKLSSLSNTDLDDLSVTVAGLLDLN